MKNKISVYVFSLIYILLLNNTITTAINDMGSADTLYPYLQTPTSTSINISWKCDSSVVSTVEYGLTETLGNTQSGSYEKITDGRTNVNWHTVHLEKLTPNTVYYYKCISDTFTSDIHKFRTQPVNGFNNGHFRFAVLGDNRSEPKDFKMIIDSMKSKMIELYGEDVENQINFVFDVGDIIDNGNVLSQFQREYFEPIRSLSSSLPFMVSIGNHERESPLFYKHMKYEEFGGAEGEKYYSFIIGRILFIAINSNIRNDTQMDWLKKQLKQGQNDTNIDWIFTFCHHPGHSEIWPDGNTEYIQKRVIPALKNYSKSEFLIYGHSHNYERGAVLDGRLRLMLNGGAGSKLDRWRQYNNQRDYPEIQKAFDKYCYSIFDFDVSGKTYICKTYSLGHKQKKLNNVVIDSLTSKRAVNKPDKPIAITNNKNIDLHTPFTLQASKYSDTEAIQSSQFQITDVSGDYSFPIIDVVRDYENIYSDSGPPNWEPINLNKGIRLDKYELTTKKFPLTGTYYWRVRYKNQNLYWSDWSNEQTITISSSGYKPISVHNKSLTFDGKKSFIKLQKKSSDYVLPKKEITIEVWAKINSFDKFENILGKLTNNNSVQKGWYLGLKNKSFSFGLSSIGADDGNGNITEISSIRIKPKQWYHVAATYDGTTMKLYVNGFLQKTSKQQSGNILYDENSSFLIGKYISETVDYILDGEIDEIRLWNKALSEESIHNNMNKEITKDNPDYNNLIGYWNINEGVSIHNINDVTDNNTGILLNMNANNVLASSAPVGNISKFVNSQKLTVIGDNGVSLEVKITSEPDKIHTLGIYKTGDNDGSIIKNEAFPGNIKYRNNIIWGIFEYGRDIVFGKKIIADVGIDYSNISGISTPDSVRLLKRNNVLADWVDVTDLFSHNKKERKFNITGANQFEEEYAIGLGKTAADVLNDIKPLQFKLNQNYPNPFNPSTVISFSIPAKNFTELNVFNLLGEKVETLISKELNAGEYQYIFNGNKLSSGIYFYRLKSGALIKTRKMILLQ